MGLDWRALTWWEYSAALFAWNARQSPDDTPAMPDRKWAERVLALN